VHLFYYNSQFTGVFCVLIPDFQINEHGGEDLI
jgi:hypothetical protein